MSMSFQKEKRARQHPYLSGNFAPIQQTRALSPCEYSGTIPKELWGGQYVRNGGNPVSHEQLGRDAHWFDGDGMLSGVAFRRPTSQHEEVQPEFVNQFILTDLYLSKRTTLVRSAIMPSISTLINPVSTLAQIVLCILRTLFLVLLSHLPGSQQAIKRISVANTALLYHDGRALATCESGPPIRVQLPSLDTVGWFDGHRAEGEAEVADSAGKESPFGGDGLLSFMREWTTGHPKVDPSTNEMLLYHSTFLPPYVHYSVIPGKESQDQLQTPLVNKPVAGVSGAKMMHDFGVSRSHTLIMDLPLTLDPRNLLTNGQVVSYDSSQPSRFGIFPRRDPSNVRWYTTSSCCIFHTANMWDVSPLYNNTASSVHLLACRMTSATLVYSAGNIAPPGSGNNICSSRASAEADQTSLPRTICRFEKASELESPWLLNDKVSADCPMAYEGDIEKDQCRLYYYEFDLSVGTCNKIAHQWALAAIPFEFPSVRPDRGMQAARYIYGCSTSSSSFGAALGRAVKIDVLAKIDVESLIRRGKQMQLPEVTGCVDTRTVQEILNSHHNNIDNNHGEGDTIQLFQLPPNHFAQEPRFVPRSDSSQEDAGFLLFYVFDESQISPSGECDQGSVSELWILNAQNMRDVVAKVRLPQRVPYGLHGTWFSEDNIQRQRSVEHLRSLEDVTRKKKDWALHGTAAQRLWMRTRAWIERAAG